jgi:hypothetical protein
MVKVTKVLSSDKIVESRSRYIAFQHLFEHLDVEKIKPNCTMAEIKKKYGSREKKELAVRMAHIMLQKIVDDVVLRAYTYSFTHHKKNSKKYTLEVVKFTCKQGPHFGNEFLRFKFCIDGRITKPIRLSRKYEDLLWDYKLKVSNPNKVKTYKDYVNIVNEQFPEFKRSDISRILRCFDTKLRYCLDKDIRIKTTHIKGFFFYNDYSLINDSESRHDLFNLKLDDQWVVSICPDRVRRDNLIYRQNLKSKSPFARKYDTTTAYFNMSKKNFEKNFIPQKDEDVLIFENVYLYRKYNYGLRSCVYFRIKNFNFDPKRVRMFFSYLEVKKEDLEITKYEKSSSKYIYRWFDDGCESSDNGAELSD